MGEDQNQILARVSAGELSAEEGSDLLSAASSALLARPSQAKPGTLRVKITDADSGAAKLSINIPLSLVEVGIGMGARFAPHLNDTAFERVTGAVREGSVGKVLDIFDDASREQVEIWIE
jgi:hypothetical protein